MTYQRKDKVGDDAAAWVARMDSEDWCQRDEADLQEWLATDHLRRGALLQAQAAWLSLDRAGASGSTDLGNGASSLVEARLLWDRRRIVLAGGAAAAASLIGGFIWINAGSTYATELGEIRKVPLADGSSATINSASQIEVRLAQRQRDVRLDRGEAWFQVAKDRNRPFVVAAGAVRVQAIGTAFSVRRRDGGAEVLVTEGVVETWAAQAGGHRIRLRAGQRAYVRDDAAISAVTEKPSDVDHALAWRGGLIDLRGRSLGEAIVEFNRYNGRKLVLADGALADEQFDGIFRTDDPEGFATAVRHSFGVAVDVSNPTVIRIGERKP